MEGWTWKALCNETPFRFRKNLASSGIWTRDPVIWSRDASVRKWVRCKIYHENTIQDNWNSIMYMYKYYHLTYCTLCGSNFINKATEALIYEPAHDKTIKLTCMPSEDSDQPGHPPSLIKVFAVLSMGGQGPNASSCGQWRLWSGWSESSLGTFHFVGFVMFRLIWESSSPLLHVRKILLMRVLECGGFEHYAGEK